MSYRICGVCKGRGNLWGTPRLNVDGGANLAQGNPPVEESPYSFGLTVPCWQCLGKGKILDTAKDDQGETNG